MRNLFTKFALVAMLVTLVPAAAFASDARVQSLGLQGDYIQDYTNIYAYPSSIVRYQNLVYGNLGQQDVSTSFQDNSGPNPLAGSGRGMGAYVAAKWLPGTLGIQVNENRNPISQAYGPQWWDRNRDESLSLLWGNKVGEKGAFGITFDMANSSLETKTAGTSDGSIKPWPINIPGGLVVPIPSANGRQAMNLINAQLGLSPRNSFGVAAGYTIDWGTTDRQKTADFALHFRDNSLKAEDIAAGQTLEDNGNTDIAFNGRAQIAISDNSYITPVINYYTMKRGYKFTDTTTPANNVDFDNKVTGWQAGIAESWVMRENDLLVLGINAGYEKIEYGDSTIIGSTFEAKYNTTPSIFGALEVHPAGWLAVRMGAGKPIVSKFEFKDTSDEDAVILKDSPLQYALGLGFRIGKSLDLDATLNQDFAFTGTWAASGTSTEPPFSNLSLTYRF